PGGSLFSIDNQSNIEIVGYGATFVMNKPEYTQGEWKMALSLKSVADTSVEGLTLRDSGGDGVYLGVSSVPGAANYCNNVALRNLVCDNNKRNALSVISADHLTVEGCVFRNTVGTAPE